jgi:hypothetical protein
VDRDDALVGLPFVYQHVLAWLDDRQSADENGARLGIDPSPVPAPIGRATTKHARAMDELRPVKEL